MKKLLPLFLLLLINLAVYSQNSIPNGSFEDWIPGTYDYPQYYPYTSNAMNFLRYHLPFNELTTTDAYHGDYAVRLLTNASATDTSGGYFINSSTTEGNNWHGGVPYDLMPTGIRGYYKYNVETADSGLILAAFSKNMVSIGSYFFKIGGVQNTYKLFEFTFEPPLSEPPDSVIFAATSSDFLRFNGIPGSELIIDSVTFTGVVSQPDLLNGDFEMWQSETLYSPVGWNSDENGMTRTTDSFSGDWAIQLTTFSGEENSVPVARTGRISTGYYSEACNCMKGGLPFSEQIDTLIFQYKYTPAIITDRGSVSLGFKNNGMQYYWTGQELEASENYKLVKIPFDLPIAPDSVIVEIQSSLWDNKETSYIGAVLKIDDINFKSQMLTTGVKNHSDNLSITIFPNPSGGNLTIQLPDNRLIPENGKIEIYTITGKKVLESRLRSLKSEFDISELSNGLYILKIYDGLTVYTSRFVKH